VENESGRLHPDPTLGVLWGKSNAGGRVNLLLQHLLDTAAVAEVLWDNFLAQGLRGRIDEATGGNGRSCFALVAGLHDVGKASPAFQCKDQALACEVRAAGLDWRPLDDRSRGWHHTLAGAVIVRRVRDQLGPNAPANDWIWPLIAGHHGRIPNASTLRNPPGRGNAQGLGPWLAAQDALVHRVARELGVDLTFLSLSGCPTRGVQLALAGLVVMADWIASDERCFVGIDQLADVSIGRARQRAEAAYERLQLGRGWARTRLVYTSGLIATRFSIEARPFQQDALELAEAMPAPGLLILEAPMGEGKTEAALGVAETLARRFGADGIFMGMPTQSTSDPMFTRVRAWSKELDPDVPVGLLHGRARFNREWHGLQQTTRFSGVDDFGSDDLYGVASDDGGAPSPEVPSEWFSGPKRGLLAPVTVGTVDQLLHAATRTRHVMLRHAGLAGRVVIVDEVHACDMYMAQFLFEALRWLANSSVPVVLLSATLPPAFRTDLVRAYLQGVLGKRDLNLELLPESQGYPGALAASVEGDREWFGTRSSEAWRPPMHVLVEILDEAADDDGSQVTTQVSAALSAGGCALIIRNTVARAQQTFRKLKESLGADVVLLHARLTAATRADRTAAALDALGPPKRGATTPRPHRLVVVATQLAEQSFDVDVDLLVTDLAPLDLLLQRVGRLQRHQRPGQERPADVRDPRVIVTGIERQDDAPPLFPRGSSYVYGDYLLLRAAALVEDAAANGGWEIPTDVPQLVKAAYGDEPVVPISWEEAAERARDEWDHALQERRARAEQFLLAGEDQLGVPTLAGLHDRFVADLDDEATVAAVVRDGEPTVEVVLVRRDDRGYTTLSGRPMGPLGEGISDTSVVEEVVGSTVRLPVWPELTRAALDLAPLPGWSGDAWLCRMRALVLDERGSACLGGRVLTYDEEVGLLDVPST